MKKLLALLLALVMVLSLAACVNTDPTEPATEPTEKPLEIEKFEGNFTYNDWVTTLSAYWNPHDYETSDQSYPISFLTAGLYEFLFNDELHPVEGKDAYDGYVIVPEMAAGLPVDVTEKIKDSHPQYGIPESATAGFAYTIDLNPLATWEDGTKIKAVDYIESMKRLLDPRYQNYRANSYYSGSLCIVGAENYHLQGQSSHVKLGKTAQAWLDAGGDINNMYVNIGDFWGITTAEGSKWGKVTDDTLIRDPAVPEGEDGDYVSSKWIYENYFAPGTMYHDAYSASYCAYLKEYPANVAWDTVGIFESGEYQITIVLDQSLAGFNLLYNLGSNWLVKTDLYDKCMTETDGVWTSTYNTSKETTMSYGPYKMTEYQTDTYMTFVKNDNWYGHTDGKHIYKDPVDGKYYPMYQTTQIECRVVAEVATAKMMFLKGQLMGYGLQPEDFEEYRHSEYCHFSPGASTFFLLLNGHKTAIAEREAADSFDKTTTDLETMMLLSFHRAMGLAFDKTEFIESISPADSPAFGLIGTAYIYDPDTGAKYRDTEQAKKVLCEVYGVDTTKFDNLDDAVASITGYDPDQAKVWFKKAFDEAIAAGYITDTNNDGISDQTVTLTYSASSVSDKLTQRMKTMTDMVNKVTVGTPFENKIAFVAPQAGFGNQWADKIKAGQADTCLGGWTGGLMDPFGLIEVYTNPEQQFDAQWWDSSACFMELEINGEKIKMNLADWTKVLNGKVVNVNGKDYNFGEGIASADIRLQILAGMEKTILLEYNYLPMMEEGSMALLSQKAYYVVEEYNPVMGRGGIAYLKYNYNDTEWETYVASQPDGILKY